MADKYADAALQKIVAGETALIIDFDGPQCSVIGTEKYHILTSQGVTAEGAAVEGYDVEEALELYADRLRQAIRSNRGKQLAWRQRPILRDNGNRRFHVYSRLAFIGEHHG